MFDRTMTPDVEGAACRPNISPTGRRKRRRFGFQWAGLAVAAAAAGVAFRVPWGVRVLVAVPAALAAVGLLQARRQTCVLRAHQGTLEHDDFTTESAPGPAVEASRKVAAGIQRDALLVGLGAGTLAAASAFVR